MTITLTQTTEAAHPDRPRADPITTAGIGLRVTAETGINGSELSLTLAESLSGWNVRLAVRVQALTDWLTVARLLDAQHDQPHVGPAPTIAELHVDAEMDRLEATFADGQSLTAPLHAELGWRVIELGYEPDAQRATWSVDGVVRDTVQPIDLPPLAALRIGGVRRAVGTSGTVDLDELVVAGQPVGPVPVAPLTPFAVDPARWLVLYNRADTESRQWVAQYGTARAIPFGHRLGLDLPPEETTDEATFRAMAGAVEDYLTRWNLSERIVGILCGHRVPGAFVDDAGVTHSVADLLRRRDLAPLAGTASLDSVANPVADPAALPDREALLDTSLPRLTARIDGADAAASMTWTDRALALEDDALPESAKLWVDTETDAPALVHQRDTLRDWVGSLRQQATRLETLSSADEPDGDFPQVANDAFAFTFGPDDPPTDFFTGDGAGRLFAMHQQISGAAWQTLRGTDSGWVAATRAAGYAATAGVIRATTPGALPFVGTFIDALRCGWTLAEAWAAASPWVGAGMTLIGDPLLTAAFPRRGWDLFGPLDTPPTAAPLDTPVAHLRFEQREWSIPEPLRPTAGETAWFAIRAVDAQGAASPGWHALGVQTLAGEPVIAPPRPAWPDRPGWRPTRVGGAWGITTLWPRRFAAAGITRVVLQREQVGGSVVEIEARPVEPRRRAATFEVPVALDATERYRLRAEAANGAFVHSPWSAWLTASQPQPGEVMVL